MLPDKTMKTSFLPQLFAHTGRRVDALGCCLTALLVSMYPVQAQFVQTGGTNSYNLYAYNGTTLATYGGDPDPGGPFGGEPIPGLPTPIFYSGSGTIPPTAQVMISPGGVVSSSATFTLGPNPTGA